MLRLGCARRCITPKTPVRLCGYGTRTGPFEGVAEDLWLRVHALEQDGCRLVLAYADLLWWNSEFAAEYRPAAEAALGLGPGQLQLVASHNHSGPGTGESFIAPLETCDAGYRQFLYEQLLAAAAEALGDLEPVEALRYDGECALNVYRRVLTGEGVQMWPNYAVPADHHLTLLEYRRPGGSAKGLLVHYPCHANLSNGNLVQPDYPGAALRLLEEGMPGCTGLFLQGCTGDLRPNSVLGDRFVPCDYERVKLFAAAFAQRCQSLLQTGGQPVTGALGCRTERLALPLDQPFTRRQAEEACQSPDEPTRLWAQKVLQKGLRAEETLEVHLLRIAGQPVYLFNAEVVQSYAAFARAVCPGALCAGYANGMIGYLANARQMAEGGYEPAGSALYFALAGVYSPRIEPLICDALARLAQG